MALAKAKEIASSAPVVVFSKTYCEYCKQVKQLLTQLGATYKVIELDVESDGTALQSALTEWTGQRTAPNVFIGGKHIGVCDGTKSLITKLFQALEDGSISIANANLDVIKKLELSLSPKADTVQMTSLSPKEEIHSSSSSEQDSDPEDKEISDDDDRNHKHRRREVRPHSFDNDVHAPPIRRPNRKRNKPFENGQRFLETDPPSSLEREVSSRSEKRRAGLTPQTRALPDSGPRARVNQFRSDSGSRFDSSASTGCPSIGRGRGRNTVPWSQHDSRFNQYDTLDFASQMASQGPPTHSSLFVGTGLPSAASTQNTSWGAYGFIPGMNNRILDTLHPLGLQGTLQPPINPLLNIGMPRQRCRDFEERGFCLRGDMCPMEHGVNRIVVEDVQSLSQFNLPVSIPSSHALGIQAGAGSVPPVSASSSLLTNSKAASTKNNKSGATDDALKLNNGVSSASGVAEADVYDPDQPLWNNEHPETSSAHLRLPTPNNDDDTLWEADSSGHQGVRLIDGIESEHAGRSFAANIGSVWGRIGHGNKSETGRKANNNTNVTGHIGNEMKMDHEEALADNRASTQGKRVAGKEMGPKATAIQPLPRLRAESGRNGGRASQKASRTLYVNGIPQKSNKREALLSHFQKFGEVIDIYIPLNSEKAFVQFSKREEAEAALKAPDAVMGNRFIKLWWANRDTISDEGDGSAHNKSTQSPVVAVPSVASQLSIGGRGKENLPSTAPKGSSALGAETSLQSGIPPKSVSANGPKAAPPVQKKVEGLELLKEELRKKQEILDKKRDEFRRQLAKLEKQRISSKKGEVAFEQAGRRHKGDMTHEAEGKAAASTPPTNISTTGAHQEAEKTLEKRHSGEILVLSSSKENSTTLQQSPRNIKQTCCLPALVLDRFKLDNSPTSFRVVPPLPAEFANVAALKDHFSSFGDLSSVVLEEPEVHSENAGLKPSHNCSACVTFTTRHSAMRAFLTGKCWQGHNLQFMWLTASPNSSTDHNIQETSTPMRALSADVQAEVVTSADVQAEVATAGSSALTAGKSTCNVMSEVAAIGNGVSGMDTESANFAPVSIPKALVQTSDSSAMPCEEHPPMSDVPLVEDNMNICFAK